AGGGFCRIAGGGSCSFENRPHPKHLTRYKNFLHPWPVMNLPHPWPLSRQQVGGRGEGEACVNRCFSRRKHFKNRELIFNHRSLITDPRSQIPDPRSPISGTASPPQVPCGLGSQVLVLE